MNDCNQQFINRDDATSIESESEGCLLEDVSADIQQLLTEEIDLEIDLRARLAETIESRITWALLLQGALDQHFNADLIEGLVNVFQDSAIETYDAVQSSSNFLTSQDVTPPLSIVRGRSQSSTAEPPPPPPPPVRKHSTRLISNGSFHPTSKFLFIRDATRSPVIVYKLICPECGRFDFPNTQGLLNHVRLKHKKAYGSHDECIQECAIIVPEDEQTWVITHGTEVTGMSLSLRRLFEMAVGGDNRVFTSQHEDYDDDSTRTEDVTMETTESELGTHLSRTLGHHKDTPALAPFLGRAPKQRCINVYGDDEVLDIVGDNADTSLSEGHAWQKSYISRSLATHIEEDTMETSVDLNNSDSGDIRLADQRDHSVMNNLNQDVSRFHITTRLEIEDWSLRIPEASRKKYPENVTHKWMVSVYSPTYKIHASTVLARMIVTSATNPPPECLSTPLVVTDPPFSVLSTTDKPFMAKITLEWAGCLNKPTNVEHWVELDSGKLIKPVLGDRQTIDVELDRNTELLPRRDDTWTVDWHSDMEKKRATARVTPLAAAISDPEHITTLKSLLPRFPMTMKDVKYRIPPRLPYMLALSPSHYEAMVPGRRKAIEWGRASALWEAYNVTVTSSRSPTDVTPVDLSIGDVYRWLADSGHFPRPPRASLSNSKAQSSRSIIAEPVTDASTSASDLHCSICGIHLTVHPGGATCAIYNRAARAPLINVQAMLRRGDSEAFRSNASGSSPSISSAYTHRDIVALADPSLTRAIQKLAIAFPRQSSVTTEPATPGSWPAVSQGFLGPRSAIEADLAPYALLATISRILIRHLVQGGLDVRNRSAKHYASLHRNPEGSKTSKTQLLTPSHIIQGLHDGVRDGKNNIHALCLARLGYNVSSDLREEHPRSLL